MNRKRPLINTRPFGLQRVKTNEWQIYYRNRPQRTFYFANAIIATAVLRSLNDAFERGFKKGYNLALTNQLLLQGITHE